MKKQTKTWLEFAQDDLKSAKILLEKKSYRACSWHCHQAIEKLLKAVVVEHGRTPDRTHDLVKLTADAHAKLPTELVAFLEELNFHYLPPRYPDMYEEMKAIYRPWNTIRVHKMTRVLFLWLRTHLNGQR